MTQLTPVVLCGPSSVNLLKPVVLNVQHCASLRHGQWTLSVWASDSPLDAPPAWNVRYLNSLEEHRRFSTLLNFMYEYDKN